MQLSDFADRFERSVLPLKKRSTRATVRSHLNLLLPRLGHLELDQFTYPTVQAFITQLSQEKAPKTVRTIWGTLHNILRRAEREGLVLSVPQPDLPEPDYQDERCFEVAELRALIAASPVPAFDALLAETGARLGEALALVAADLSASNLTLRIDETLFRGEAGTPKTRSGFRTISISPWLCELLLPLAEDGRPLFRTRNGTPWCSNKAGEHIHEVCEAAGVPREPGDGAHAYRRGNITAMVSVLGISEKVASYRVGHKPKSLTLGLYCRPVPGFDKSCANQLAELLKP